MRGENLTVGTDRLFIIGSPPLARGKLANCCCETREARITPACAGKTRLCCVFQFHIKDHPRLRGENSIRTFKKSCELGSPPLARGKHRKIDDGDTLKRITPACAVKTGAAFRLPLGFWDHPRLRGENYLIYYQCIYIIGSPPLARGKLYRVYSP